jgi:hypothetical protein
MADRVSSTGRTPFDVDLLKVYDAAVRRSGEGQSVSMKSLLVFEW